MIDFYKDKNTVNWLLKHPGKINKAFLDTQPMSESWIEESISDPELPYFTKENADQIIFFGCIQMLLKKYLKEESQGMFILS